GARDPGPPPAGARSCAALAQPAHARRARGADGSRVSRPAARSARARHRADAARRAAAPEPGTGGAVVSAGPLRRNLLRLLPWAITAVCFAWLYARIGAAAARAGQGALPFLASVFAGVAWGRWLALMIPYSLLYLLIDSAVIWRVVSWFNAPLRYADV